MKPTIADVLHLAADKYLASDLADYGSVVSKHRYSCCAISEATYELKVEAGKTFEFVSSLGCNTGSTNLFNKQEQYYRNFESYRATEKSQGYRYLWLKFAAAMAESEGI